MRVQMEPKGELLSKIQQQEQEGQYNFEVRMYSAARTCTGVALARVGRH